jgi:glycerophosphoryl diester phosphodiesterase
MTLAEIRKLDAGFKFTMDHGRTFPYRGRGLRVPTLGEVLDTFPEMWITVELKQTRAAVAEALARVLQARRAEDRVIVASHEHALLAAFRAAAPSVATSFSKDEVREFLLRLRGGTMGGYRPPAVAFQVPEYKGLRRVVSKSVIEAVHGFGVEVHVWTVNEPVHIARLLSWGVDGIMTDDPARAIANVALLRGLRNAAGGNHA